MAILVIFPTLLFSRQKTNVIHPGAEVPYQPWFTGPFLAPTPVNMVPGHPAVQPSVTVFNMFGRYDSDWKFKNEKNTWAILPLVDFQFAITENTGIETIASFVTKFKDGKSDTNLEDTIVLFGYQVSNDQKNSWIPDCRLFFQTIFPSGKHDQLDLVKEGLDLTGQGAYFFGPNLSFQKLFYLPNNFFILHWSLGYFFPTRASIKGFNAYGGGFGTKGKIRPGQFGTVFLSGEYSFNQHWVFAFDTLFLYQGKTSRFKGKRGVNEAGEPAKIGLPSSIEISFAPEVEYNINAGSGLLFGAWFTLAGRNIQAFGSIFFSYLYVF